MLFTSAPVTPLKLWGPALCALASFVGNRRSEQSRARNSAPDAELANQWSESFSTDSKQRGAMLGRSVYPVARPDPQFGRPRYPHLRRVASLEYVRCAPSRPPLRRFAPPRDLWIYLLPGPGSCPTGGQTGFPLSSSAAKPATPQMAICRWSLAAPKVRGERAVTRGGHDVARTRSRSPPLQKDGEIRAGTPRPEAARNAATHD